MERSYEIALLSCTYSTDDGSQSTVVEVRRFTLYSQKFVHGLTVDGSRHGVEVMRLLFLVIFAKFVHGLTVDCSRQGMEVIGLLCLVVFSQVGLIDDGPQSTVSGDYFA